VRICLIPGDGIGQEVVPEAWRVITALIPNIESVDADAGWGTFERTGISLPPETVATLKSCDGAIFGAVSSPSTKVEGYRSPIVLMRRELNLYANIRPLKQGDIDMVVVRENTEGLYAGRERMENDDTAITERVITRQASARIAKMAGEIAMSRSQRVTVVHKANVVRVSDGLFREAALQALSEFPELSIEEQLVDSMAYRMVREPEAFDVVVAPNLYGDILSDLGAGLTGGLGLAPSANVADDFVVAEPVHGSAPDIEGQGKANPLATIRAAALMLSRLGHAETSARILTAVESVIADGPHTPDLGGTASTSQVTDAVLEQLGCSPDPKTQETSR
jgi:homoisocitrate dehydrogenase